MSSECNGNFDPKEEMRYMPTYWSHRYDRNQVIENFEKNISKWSEKINNTIPQRIINCNDLECKGMSVFSEDLPNESPIFAFIHGGYWISGSKESYHFIAEPMRKNGIVTSLIGYNLATSVTLISIVEEIKQNVLQLVQLAKVRGSRGIYLCGHSAGAHLAAMLFSSEWMNNPIMKKYIKGVVFISGVYDLYPLLKTSLFEVVKEVIESANPSKYMKEISSMMKETNMKVIVAIAEYDTPKFIEQSQNYHKKLQEFGVSSKYLFIKNEDHFSIIENLRDQSFILTKTILNFINGEE